MRASADHGAAVAESNEGNNSAVLGFRIKGNKVENGSFEQEASGGSAPAAWSGSSTQAGSASWSDSGTEGSKGASASGNGGNAAAHGSPTWTSAPIDVVAGELLDLQVSVSSFGASSAPTVGLLYLGPLGNVLAGDADHGAAVDGWVRDARAGGDDPGRRRGRAHRRSADSRRRTLRRPARSRSTTSGCSSNEFTTTRRGGPVRRPSARRLPPGRRRFPRAKSKGRASSMKIIRTVAAFAVAAGLLATSSSGLDKSASSPDLGPSASAPAAGKLANFEAKGGNLVRLLAGAFDPAAGFPADGFRDRATRCRDAAGEDAAVLARPGSRQAVRRSRRRRRQGRRTDRRHGPGRHLHGAGDACSARCDRSQCRCSLDRLLPAGVACSDAAAGKPGLTRALRESSVSRATSSRTTLLLVRSARPGADGRRQRPAGCARRRRRRGDRGPAPGHRGPPGGRVDRDSAPRSSRTTSTRAGSTTRACATSTPRLRRAA